MGSNILLDTHVELTGLFPDFDSILYRLKSRFIGLALNSLTTKYMEYINILFELKESMNRPLYRHYLFIGQIKVI